MKEETKKICRHCEYYDLDTQRNFHRKVGPKNKKGERTEIVEVRAVCRNKNATAHGHLVMDKSEKDCFKERIPKQKKRKKDEEKTSPDEYHGASEAVAELEKQSDSIFKKPLKIKPWPNEKVQHMNNIVDMVQSGKDDQTIFEYAKKYKIPTEEVKRLVPQREQ